MTAVHRTLEQVHQPAQPKSGNLNRALSLRCHTRPLRLGICPHRGRGHVDLMPSPPHDFARQHQGCNALTHGPLLRRCEPPHVVSTSRAVVILPQMRQETRAASSLRRIAL